MPVHLRYMMNNPLEVVTHIAEQLPMLETVLLWIAIIGDSNKTVWKISHCAGDAEVYGPASNSDEVLEEQRMITPDCWRRE